MSNLPKEATGQEREKRSNRTRINREITAREVRLVDPDGLLLDVDGVADPRLIGLMSRDTALGRAQALNLDLVEISPNANPPVVRIMNYGKFLFEEKKGRRKQKIIKVKEIKLRPVTDEGDYQVKLRNLLGFLKEGNKVKVTLRFRGREVAHQDLGVNILERIQREIGSEGVVESMPKLEGRQLVMVIAPGKRVNQQNSGVSDGKAEA
ncbi:MAG: translation initiation factor IF-3 [Pseudomonadota bacterium]